MERTVFANNKANQAKLFENGRLKAGPKPTEVTEEIEKTIELDFELFSRAVYSEQNQIDSFLRLSPAERKKSFDELLELDRYERARGSSVQLLNSLKRISEERKRSLKELQPKVSEKECLEILEKIAFKEKELLRVEREKEGKALELGVLEKTFKDLESKRKRFESLVQEIQRSGGSLEELEKAVESLRPEAEGVVLEKEKIKARQKALGLEVSAMKESEKVARALASEIDSLSSNRRFFEEEAKAQKQKGQLNEALHDRKTFTQEIEALGTDSLCPTCSQKLSITHKEQLLGDAKAKISELEKKLETNSTNSLNVEAKKKQCLQEIELARQARTALEKSFEILQKIKSSLEKAREFEKQVLEKQELLQAKKPEFSGKELEILEAEEKKLARALELALKLESAGVLRKKILESERELKELAFKPEVFENSGRKIAALKAELNAVEKEFFSLKESLGDFGKSLRQLQAWQKELDNLQEQVESSVFFAEKLGIFVNALQSTQGELRGFLIQNANAAMQDVWPKVYPYKDYLNARIEIVDGNYEVKALSRTGKWVKVEGILSGGERMAAAITIRVAFSLVLTQQLSWLILDEPTHNLDRNAVKVLSTMLKEHLPELVEQVFVITHDRELEKAASSCVFEIVRNKDEDGASSVTLKSD
ncbi:MAG: exonuclease SbcC [archaeon GW2011_AR21]|nr:MAG: exonuclease SbcC [archaeon GW2011_AR21]